MADKSDKGKKIKSGDTKIDDLDYRVNQSGDVEQVSQDEGLLSLSLIHI